MKNMLILELAKQVLAFVEFQSLWLLLFLEGTNIVYFETGQTQTFSLWLSINV